MRAYKRPLGQKGENTMGEGLREIRNSDNRLLGIVNDSTGEGETNRPYYSSHTFSISNGGTFTVVRDNLKSLASRNPQ